MIITMKDYLNEGTPAAETLAAAQRTQPNTTAAAKALEMFMRLSPKDQEDHLDFLAKSLHDYNDGAGVGDDVAAKNRKGLKDNPSKNKKSLADIRKGLKEAFPDTSDELLEKMADLFSDAVNKKVIVSALEELFTEEPVFSLLFGDVSEPINAAEFLADRIGELEEQISVIEDENQALYEAIVQQPSDESLMEDFLVSNQTKAQKPYQRQHNIADDLGFNPDPDNAVLMEDASQPRRQNANDPMSRYSAYIKQTAGGRPIEPSSQSASVILETWERTQR